MAKKLVGIVRNREKGDRKFEGEWRNLGGDCKSLPITSQCRRVHSSSSIPNPIRSRSRFTNGDIHLNAKSLH